MAVEVILFHRLRFLCKSFVFQSSTAISGSNCMQKRDPEVAFATNLPSRRIQPDRTSYRARPRLIITTTSTAFYTINIVPPSFTIVIPAPRSPAPRPVRHPRPPTRLVDGLPPDGAEKGSRLDKITSPETPSQTRSRPPQPPRSRPKSHPSDTLRKTGGGGRGYPMNPFHDTRHRGCDCKVPCMIEVYSGISHLINAKAPEAFL
jgi:hypothetical protein